MKIKKGTHTVKMVEAVNPASHIPLAYLYGDEKVYDCNVIQEKPASGIRKVIPYERFDSYDQCLFKSYSQQPDTLSQLVPVDSSELLKRDRLGYYYEPAVSTKFEPHTFWYTLLCQRTQAYLPHQTYNLKINCIDNKANELSDALIQIFADAPTKGFVPKNVWVNSKDLSLQSLSNRPLTDNDFLFISSQNGQTYSANGEKIDYEHLLSQHTNLWLCCSDITLLEEGTAQLSQSILYNESLTCHQYTFLNSSFADHYLPEGGESLKFFSGDALACIVRHYDQKGFIIISSEQFIKKSADNYRMIYEILMQIYLQSYLETQEISGYVCDEPIDYIVKRNSLIAAKSFRSEKTYYQYFNSYHASDFQLLHVSLSDPAVEVTHQPDYVYFKKVGGATQPKKPLSGYSVLLETGEVAFVDQWHYIANTQISYTLTKENEFMLLNLPPFCLDHVLNEQTLQLKLPLTEVIHYEVSYKSSAHYYIIYDQMQFKCLEAAEWQGEGKCLLSVYLYLKEAPIQLIDMRTRGGGLPENKKDNYNLLDIGHNQGRPFRKSGAYVIKLPLTAKPYHDAIMDKLNQISAANKFYTIIYEQRTDEFEGN